MFRGKATWVTLVGRIALGFCLVMAQAIEATAQTPAAKPQKVKVEKNQLIEMALEETISSASAKEGDQISFRLTESLLASGETVLPAGFVLRARVTKAEKAGPNCKAGKLEWELENPKSADGTTIRLRKAEASRLYGKGKLVELEPPRTFREKLRIALLAPVIAVGFILIAPIYVAMVAAEPPARCYEGGYEETFRGGFLAHAAVKESVSVVPSPKTEDADAEVGENPAPAPQWPRLPIRLMP